MSLFLFVLFFSLVSFGRVNSVNLRHTDTVLEAIHRGDHYFVKTYVETSGADSTAQFMFTTPNTATRVHAKALMASNAEYLVQIYEGITTSDEGTPISGINNNRNSSKTSLLQAYSSPTVTDTGLLIWQVRLGSGKDSAGVAPGLSYEVFAKTNSKYLFKITKITSGDGYVDFDFFWIEE